MSRTRILIMGAAGRDFHNFNVYFRDNEAYEVVAFTATQIPGIGGRRYPAELAGRLYPEGIPIYDEVELDTLIHQHNIEQVIFAYSDVKHEYVMHKASQVLAAGADYRQACLVRYRGFGRKVRQVFGPGSGFWRMVLWEDAPSACFRMGDQR